MKAHIFIAILGSVMACVTLANGAPVHSGRPAVWIPHELIVSLHNLPRRYSCDELWYKFHDVLLAIGARPNMRILAYQCEGSLGALARSPRVELKFALPSEVHGAQTRWSDVAVVTKTVRIAPGEPPSIDDRDCMLLKQMKSDLLDVLPVRVLAFNLACAAPQSSHQPFGISAQALTPVDEGQKRVVARDRQTRPRN